MSLVLPRCSSDPQADPTSLKIRRKFEKVPEVYLIKTDNTYVKCTKRRNVRLTRTLIFRLNEKRPFSLSPLHPLTPLGQLFHFLQGTKISSIPANVILHMGKKCVQNTKALLQRLCLNKSEVTNRILK